MYRATPLPAFCRYVKKGSDVTKKYRVNRRISIAVLISIGLIGFGGWWLLSRQSSASLTPKGGEGWNASHTVGVRVEAGSLSKTTQVIFSKGQLHEKAPADALLDVVGEVATITPDHAIAQHKAEVLFKAPSGVATDVNCSDHNPHRKRSICNVSIEVYNTAWHAWIPLDTRIEHGDTLVATAPHFSDYRLGETKAGTVTVDLGRKVALNLDGNSSPFGLIGDVVKAYVKQFADNLTGTFNSEKIASCDTAPAPDYSIDFTGLRPGNKLNACVVKDHGNTKLLVANGWSIPLIITADTDHGVTAERFNQSEFTTALRNWDLGRTVLKGNSTIASGLDTATFTIDDSIVPNSFTVNATASLYGAIDDIGLAIFDLFPATKTLAPHAGKVKDILNCGSTIYHQHSSNEKTAVPENLADEYAELTQKCLTPIALEKAELGDYADAVAKDTKAVTSELSQTTDAAAKYLTLQGDIAHASFVVSKPKAALIGQWSYECQGAGNHIDFVGDGSDSWVETEYDAQNNAKTYNTFFHVDLVQGHPVLTIDKTELPESHAGDKIDIQFLPVMDGRKPGIQLTSQRDGNEWLFFQAGGASYC